MAPDLQGSFREAQQKVKHLGIIANDLSMRTTYARQPRFPYGQKSVYWQSVKPGTWMRRTDIIKVRTVKYLQPGR